METRRRANPKRNDVVARAVQSVDHPKGALNPGGFETADYFDCYTVETGYHSRSW